MKKLTAVFLAVALIFVLMIPAFAADPSDVSYFKLSKAAEDITFEYNGITQDSDRIFYKIDGVYYLYYFSPITGTTSVNGDRTFAVKTYKSYKFDGSNWVAYNQANSTTEGSALPLISSVAYSEKEYKVGSYVVSDNVTALHRGLRDSVDSRDLSGIWQTIKPLIPILLPAIVLFLAFRKGWSFLKGETASA